MPRSYGARKPAKIDQRAAATGLLVNARVLPTVETLIRSYGLKPSEAMQMLEAERVRRARIL